MDYQPIYDAVARAIGHPDLERAMAEALSQADFHVHAQRAAQVVIDEATTPAVLYRPRVFVDGNRWCALYGDNVQDGVAGFGDSPHEAVVDFNRRWFEKLPAAAKKE